jgi:Ger(x)C family germination protein
VLKKAGLIIIVFLLFNLCGCWDSQDLEDLSFPLAAAYDVHLSGSADSSDPPAEPGYKLVDLTTLVPNLAPKAEKPVNIKTLSGITIADARQRQGLTDADTYVTGMNQVIIMGEELARTGLNPFLDSLLRSPTVSGSMYFAVAAGRGEDILKTPIKNYNNMGIYLVTLFNGIQQRTFIPVTRMEEFQRYQSTGKNPVAPILEQRGDRVIISGVAIFKKDRLVKKLDIEEGHELVLLRGIKGRSFLPFSRKVDGTYHRGAVLVSNSRKVKYNQNQQGHNFFITVKLNGSLEEHGYQALITEEHLQEIEKTIEQQVQTQCEIFINKMQEEIKVDCIDISKFALAKNRRVLEKDIDKPEFIQNANIQVKVKVHLQNVGETR